MRARWYDTQSGVFTSVDPAVSSTNQPYQYANGDPVNNSDPSGMSDGVANLPSTCTNAFGGPSGARWAKCKVGVFPRGIVYTPFAEAVGTGASINNALTTLWYGVWVSNPSETVNGVANYGNTTTSSGVASQAGKAIYQGCQDLPSLSFYQWECDIISVEAGNTNSFGLIDSRVPRAFDGFDQSLGWYAALSYRGLFTAVSNVAQAAEDIASYFIPSDALGIASGAADTYLAAEGLTGLQNALDLANAGSAIANAYTAAYNPGGSGCGSIIVT